MILIFKDWAYPASEYINEIENDEKNFLLIFDIENWIYDESEKILRDKNIVFWKFSLKLSEFIDFRFVNDFGNKDDDVCMLKDCNIFMNLLQFLFNICKFINKILNRDLRRWIYLIYIKCWGKSRGFKLLGIVEVLEIFQRYMRNIEYAESKWKSGDCHETNWRWIRRDFFDVSNRMKIFHLVWNRDSKLWKLSEMRFNSQKLLEILLWLDETMILNEFEKLRIEIWMITMIKLNSETW